MWCPFIGKLSNFRDLNKLSSDYKNLDKTNNLPCYTYGSKRLLRYSFHLAGECGIIRDVNLLSSDSRGLGKRNSQVLWRWLRIQLFLQISRKHMYLSSLLFYQKRRFENLLHWQYFYGRSWLIAIFISWCQAHAYSKLFSSPHSQFSRFVNEINSLRISRHRDFNTNEIQFRGVSFHH